MKYKVLLKLKNDNDGKIVDQTVKADFCLISKGKFKALGFKNDDFE